MYDLVITLHDVADEVVGGFYTPVHQPPIPEEIERLFTSLPHHVHSVVVSITKCGSPELLSLDVYEVVRDGSQN